MNRKKQKRKGKKMNEKEKYCPQCGELLKLHKDGVMKDKQGLIGVYIYICEECNQAYGLTKENELGLLPFDSDMKPIKVKCKSCNHIEIFRQRMVYIVNDFMIYEEFCPKCAIDKITSEMPNIFKEVNEKNIFKVAELHAFKKQQEVMQDPEKMKEIMKQKPYKDIVDKIDSVTKQLD